MITLRKNIETFLIILSGTAVALFITVQRNTTTSRFSFSSIGMPVVSTPFPTEAPTGPVVSAMDSPEGSKTLTVEALDTTYSVFTSIKAEGDKKTIAQREEALGQTLEIPYNTWSPNAAYFFLKEKSADTTDYLVFHSGGSLFSNGESSLSIQKLFQEKVPDYRIEEATGWGDNMLIIVNAISTEGENRASFWFDVTNQSFIRLGTYFK